MSDSLRDYVYEKFTSLRDNGFMEVDLVKLQYFTREEIIEMQGLRAEVDRLLARLKPREERVLRRRYGIGEDSNQTLEEVGSEFDVTRERIRQIQSRAIFKLRKSAHKSRLKPYLDN